MIKANEAKAMVKNYREAKEAERLAKVQKFLDNECDCEIINAASNGQTECFVEVPADLRELAPAINAHLFAMGYFSQVRYSSTPTILIRWDK
jgi:hypothetical protein